MQLPVRRKKARTGAAGVGRAVIGCTARRLVREELPAETVRTQERAKLEGLGCPRVEGNVPRRGANIERKSGSCFARKRREREVGTSIVEV